MCAKRVTVILTDAQYAQFKKRAGDVPLSRWLRTLASNEVFWNPPLTDEQLAELEAKRPKIGDTVTIRKPARFVPSIPRGEELAKGEASARSSDASGEVASRRLPKAGPHQPQKSIPVELPAKIDMKRFLP